MHETSVACPTNCWQVLTVQFCSEDWLYKNSPFLLKGPAFCAILLAEVSLHCFSLAVNRAIGESVGFYSGSYFKQNHYSKLQLDSILALASNIIASEALITESLIFVIAAKKAPAWLSDSRLSLQLNFALVNWAHLIWKSLTFHHPGAHATISLVTFQKRTTLYRD